MPRSRFCRLTIVIDLVDLIHEGSCHLRVQGQVLSILEHVRKTGKPIRITRYGKPVAEVVLPTLKLRRKSWLGSMAGPTKILGDIVGPTGSFEAWDAFRD